MMKFFSTFMIMGCSFCLYLFYLMIADVDGGFFALHLTQQIVIGMFSVAFFFGVLLFSLTLYMEVSND